MVVQLNIWKAFWLRNLSAFHVCSCGAGINTGFGHTHTFCSVIPYGGAACDANTDVGQDFPSQLVLKQGKWSAPVPLSRSWATGPIRANYSISHSMELQSKFLHTFAWLSYTCNIGRKNHSRNLDAHISSLKTIIGIVNLFCLRTLRGPMHRFFNANSMWVSPSSPRC